MEANGHLKGVWISKVHRYWGIEESVKYLHRSIDPFWGVGQLLFRLELVYRYI